MENKPKLTLVKCEPTLKPDKSAIWLRIFWKEIAKSDKDKVKIIVAGVKYIALAKPDDHKQDYDWLTQALSVYMFTLGHMQDLTPAKLAEIFPATKTYDGDKYECKDYFYAKATLKKYTKFTNEFPSELFCWEYWNKDLGLFAVNAVMLIDALRALEGEPSIMEQFFEEYGVDIPKYYERDGLLFDEDGNFVGKPKKKIPQYLKLVK